MNPMAGLPLTLYVGNVPLDLEDTKLVKIFESCGKLARIVRPSDPKSLLPASLAFVTYAQAICALRASELIHDLVVNERGDRLVVKMGSKETSVVDSVRQSELDATNSLSSSLFAGQSLESEIHAPIKKTLEILINPPPPLTIPTGVDDGEREKALEAAANVANAISSSLGLSSSLHTADSATSGTEGANSSSSGAGLEEGEREREKEKDSSKEGETLGPDGKPINYYSFVEITSRKDVDDILNRPQSALETVDEQGEKFLLSEIGKFRSRQQVREM
jgi:hypothetical protein